MASLLCGKESECLTVVFSLLFWASLQILGSEFSRYAEQPWSAWGMMTFQFAAVSGGWGTGSCSAAAMLAGSWVLEVGQVNS